MSKVEATLGTLGVGLSILGIEAGLAALKFWIKSTGRNPLCGGILGFLPVCPLTGFLSGVYRKDGDSCLSPFACKPGSTCKFGICQAPNGKTKGRKAPRFTSGTGGWCSADTDCRGGVIAATEPGEIGICVQGFCQKVRFVPIGVGEVPFCPPGSCIKISDWRGYEDILDDRDLLIGRPLIGDFLYMKHPALGVTGDSITAPIFGFNREKNDSKPSNAAKKRSTRNFNLSIALLLISVLVLVISLFTENRGFSFLLLATLVVLQVLFIIALLSR